MDQDNGYGHQKMDQHDGCKIGFSHGEWIEMLVLAIKKWTNMVVLRLALDIKHGSKSWFKKQPLVFKPPKQDLTLLKA